MSFSEIRLPDILLTDLYKAVLVDIPEDKQQAVKSVFPQNPAFSQTPEYLGGNSRNILVLVYYPKDEVIPAEQLSFLTSILKACALTIADVAIVNTAKEDGQPVSYRTTLNPNHMIWFGAQPELVGGTVTRIDFNISDEDGIRTVSVPSLESFNKDDPESKLLKRKLWDCLRQLFNI